MENISMRDSFINKLYDMAKEDKDIILISADMGAPSLDKFRDDLPNQFFTVGIAEQNLVVIATGLAMEGKKVFIYAIMPFITLRGYELIKVNLSLMNVPVTIVGVGSGFSYEESGPTHHATEDITVMRVLPNFTIFSSSDSIMASKFAEMTCETSGPSYVRLDREVLPPIYDNGTDFSDGLAKLKPGKDICIVATANMVHQALKIADKLAAHSIDAGVIDLYRLKPINEIPLIQTIEQSKHLVTLEEHLLNGGMGSAITEVLVDCGKSIPIKRFGVHDRYYYTYGGRENIQSICGLDVETVTRSIADWL